METVVITLIVVAVALIVVWPVIIGVIWTVRLLGCGQHSLRELLGLVAYWAFFIAIYSGAWMKH